MKITNQECLTNLEFWENVYGERYNDGFWHIYSREHLN